ncbi:MAG: hypothetical protein DMG72_14330 [Acidobacteria bacterium]|nr:MAG: hypothetical protein DMG72_14330 [Acidobacteriota bacterium]
MSRRSEAQVQPKLQVARVEGTQSCAESMPFLMRCTHFRSFELCQLRSDYNLDGEANDRPNANANKRPCYSRFRPARKLLHIALPGLRGYECAQEANMSVEVEMGFVPLLPVGVLLESLIGSAPNMVHIRM